MTRTTVGLTLFSCLFAVAACADSTAPSAASKTVPRAAAQTRYILASGETPPPGCRDLGNGMWLCDDGGGLLQGSSPPANTGSDDNNDQN